MFTFLLTVHPHSCSKVILVGDFNAVTHSATIQKLSERLLLSSSFVKLLNNSASDEQDTKTSKILILTPRFCSF